MSDGWKDRLENWVSVWDQLSEQAQDCFPVSRPVTRDGENAWPEDLPNCPTLLDFYARCDGGRFGSYTLLPLAELCDPSDDEWLEGMPGLELTEGKWIEFGNHDFGHALWWDSDADEVVLYNPDDEEPTRLKRTIDQFVERLFHPTKKTTDDEDDESIAMWIEALQEAASRRQTR